MKRRAASTRSDAKLEAIDFQVIGELKSDSGHLLLMSGDGRWYDYDVVHEVISPISPSNSWAVDVIESAPVRVRAEWQLATS